LNVKVHAIRDAQVVEKKQIKKEVKDEEKRLDLMMEVERVNAIKIQEEIEKKEKTRNETRCQSHSKANRRKSSR